MAFIASAFLTSNTMQPKAEVWENTEKPNGKTWAPMSQLGILCRPSEMWGLSERSERGRPASLRAHGGQRAQQGRAGLPARPHVL